MAKNETGQLLPRENGHVWTEALADIFMGRHVERLSRQISRQDFTVIRDDLAAYLRPLFDQAEAEARALPGEIT